MIIPNTTYSRPSTTTKKVTTTKEYDEKGRVVKEITVEETTTYNDNYPTTINPVYSRSMSSKSLDPKY